MRRVRSAALAVITGFCAVGQTAPVLAQACGHYIVLGCFTRHADAVTQMNRLGGPGIGGAGIAGSIGTQVVHTDDFPNFRNGYFCVMDGPYRTRADAQSIAWSEAVPDAYVKNGC